MNACALSSASRPCHLLNHNYFGRDNINTDLKSCNCGAVIASQVSTQNILPR
jgi:hypothetical protein